MRMFAAAAALIVATLPALAGGSAPSLVDPTPNRVLAWVRWLGTFSDLTDIPAVAGGLGLTPQPKTFTATVAGREVPNITDVLTEVPVAPSLAVSYRVFGQGGPAARGWGSDDSRNRAEVRLFIAGPNLCIRAADLTAAFGPPVDSEPLTDGGGNDLIWRVATAGSWRTQVGAVFGPRGDRCTSELYVSQESGTGYGNRRPVTP